MDIRNVIQGMFVMSMLLGLVAAAPSPQATDIMCGLCELYSLVSTVLAVVVFVLIVVAAVVYAGGQIMGAETRARASVWATSMIIGALIGVLIYIVLPMVMASMLPASASAQMSGGDLSTVCSSLNCGTTP
jgi:uncharacterized protein (DUF983 family)